MEQLNLMFAQSRWYTNAAINIIKQKYPNLLNQKKYSNYTIRDLMRKYNYTESIIDNNIVKSFTYDESREEVPIPPWWKDVHSRIPRGAVKKVTQNINSGLSNLRNGNISSFELKYQTKKDKNDYVSFEDKQYPKFINKIHSRYWYTTSDRKRKNISMKEIGANKGLEIIYDKEKKHYFMHIPVTYDWFPSDDRRIEKQSALINQEKRIIALDPGIRKFLVGYDPNGKSVLIGDGARNRLIGLMLEADKLQSENKNNNYIWREVKNLVAELHWKVINYLIKNYDVILLPDFRVSEMIKSKKLNRITKRLMNMFSFYKFKEKLIYKCNAYNKKLIIVDESYTSCTCTVCGHIYRTKAEEYKCSKCHFISDRDVMGSRNIYLKNEK